MALAEFGAEAQHHRVDIQPFLGKISKLFCSGKLHVPSDMAEIVVGMEDTSATALSQLGFAFYILREIVVLFSKNPLFVPGESTTLYQVMASVELVGRARTQELGELEKKATRELSLYAYWRLLAEGGAELPGHLQDGLVLLLEVLISLQDCDKSGAFDEMPLEDYIKHRFATEGIKFSDFLEQQLNVKKVVKPELSRGGVVALRHVRKGSSGSGSLLGEVELTPVAPPEQHAEPDVDVRTSVSEFLGGGVLARSDTSSTHTLPRLFSDAGSDGDSPRNGAGAVALSRPNGVLAKLAAAFRDKFESSPEGASSPAEPVRLGFNPSSPC